MSRTLLRRLAAEIYGEERARQVWGGVDLIGDIAVIKVPDGWSVEELKPLAEAILRELKYVRSVWAQVGPVTGEYRLRELVHLAGEERSETIYKEHGLRFKVDVRRVYVSPRLSYEHWRVAQLVKPGEVVVNMYAGAGFFSIVMARYAKPRKVYSIDINPDAYRYMVENVRLNRVEGIVEPILGDARRVIWERLRGVADRVLMPLPERALEHLPYAVLALKPGKPGVIHVYLHVHAGRSEEPEEKAWSEALARFRELGLEPRLLASRVVREVGPRWYQVVLDVEVTRPEEFEAPPPS